MARATGKRLPVVITPAEEKALLAVVRDSSTTGLRNRAMVQLMLGAGLRVSEVCALRGVDVDLQRGEVRVNEGKGGKDRVVPVAAETRGWLQAWAGKREALGLNGRAPFFVGIREGPTGQGNREKGQGLGVRYVQTLVARLAAAAGIEKRVSPHTLRHTYATRRLNEGFNVREVQTLLGHSNVSTTQVYTHVSPDELRAKVQAQDATEQPDPATLELAKVLQALPAEQRLALVAALTPK